MFSQLCRYSPSLRQARDLGKSKKKGERSLARMDRLQRLFGNLPGLPGQGSAGMDGPLVDTAEKVHISSLALLKMLKHGAVAAISLNAARR